MNKENVLFATIGLFIGLIIGFFAANSINRSAVSPPTAAQTEIEAPFANRQVQTVTVKEQPATQGKPLPEVAEKIDRAKKEPNNFDAQMDAGNLYVKIKSFDKAEEFYNRAEQLNPTDYEKIVQLGNSFFDTGKYEKAEKWYEQALTKKPDDVNVRTDLGITFVERANPDFDRAIKEFQTSLKTDSKHEQTLYNLGIAYFKKGNFDEAQKTLNQLKTVNPQGQLGERLKQIMQTN